MISFHENPKIAEQQMQAVIFYLTAFGFVDGAFDGSEKQFVRDYVGRLVIGRAKSLLGDKLDAHYHDIERWIEHFHEVVDETEAHIASLFTESVADGESTTQFVLAKLKLRCFELFRRFDDHTRSELLATVDELMFADGKVHESEAEFRKELYRMLLEPVEIDDADLDVVQADAIVVSAEKALSAARTDLPFFRDLEYPYARDRETFASQAASDMALIDRVIRTLEQIRGPGQGKLATVRSFSEFAPGTRFLDGHVYVHMPEPNKACELVVIGDLHGCYSCLKAALFQTSFFDKVEAYRRDPANHPYIGLVLLGDYIDRGRFSYNGVLRTVMQLFTSFPDHVFPLRGNHEYYVEIKGRVLAPVRPCEAMDEIKHVAPTEVFASYMRLFEALPTSLVLDRTMFVHAGIPRDDTIAEKLKGPESLNDPEIRFQMMWSDPSEADVIPKELQQANARFPFGKAQLRSFLSRLGLSALIRGHEVVPEGMRRVYDDADASLITLFSAGGATNEDLPPDASYRKVKPMALLLRHEGGVSSITPFAIDYARFNSPDVNAFFRDAVAAPPVEP